MKSPFENASSSRPFAQKFVFENFNFLGWSRCAWHVKAIWVFLLDTCGLEVALGFKSFPFHRPRDQLCLSISLRIIESFAVVQSGAQALPARLRILFASLAKLKFFVDDWCFVLNQEPAWRVFFKSVWLVFAWLIDVRVVEGFADGLDGRSKVGTLDDSFVADDDGNHEDYGNN